MSDLISRSALIDIFEERMQDDNVMCPIIKVLDVLEIVEEQPTVEAKPVVKGEWLHHEGYFFTPNECSACGILQEFATSFCPNCGADMRKKVD